MADLTTLAKDGNQRDFSRRQLLQMLGAAGTAVFASLPWAKTQVAFAAQAAGGGKTFPVTHVNHLDYRSADYAKSRDFYIDLFGMRDAWDDGKGTGLEFGDVKLPNGMYIRPLARPGDKANVGHMAYGIANFMTIKAAVKEEAARRGLNVRPDGYAGWSIDDPAGWMVQVTPVKDVAMFPGASPLCPEPGPSAKCKDGYESGQKMLASVPKPSGKGFSAYAFSMISMHVPDIAKEKDFYSNFLGMKLVSENSDECVLRCGDNTLNLRKGATADGKAYIDTFGLLVRNYDHAKVKAELDRRGLSPNEVSKIAWSFHDPDGFPIEVSGRAGV